MHNTQVWQLHKGNIETLYRFQLFEQYSVGFVFLWQETQPKSLFSLGLNHNPCGNVCAKLFNTHLAASICPFGGLQLN